MSAQPEALRLAEFYEALAEEPPKSPDNSNIRAAAAELRRLHAENERLHQINQSHEMKLSVRGYEIQIADLEAQRDALLEALRWIADRCPVHLSDHPLHNIHKEMSHDAGARARAAIKAVE